MPYFYGIDSTYLLFVLPAILISLWAQMRVNSTFSRYSQVPTMRGLTGAQAAQAVLRAAGVSGVRIERIAGRLSDHYDPRENVIRLSDAVYGASSVAAVGVAAHEAGHAVQYAENYMPIRIRAAVIPATRFGSTLAWPLVILGLMLNAEPLAWAGIILFGTVIVFQLVTLPVEYNASRRALHALDSGMLLGEDELGGARDVLSAAALTYLAALLVSLGQLLRLLSIVGRSNRRK